MIYYKRYTGKLLPQKTAEQPSWVQWTHHSEGKTHCEECLMLDGCFFTVSNHPPAHTTRIVIVHWKRLTIRLF